jgi:DNA-binding winged helix-turn-helix (wHTH) protein
VQHIRFGAFDLDPGSRELRKDGVRVPVPGQSLHVLALLLAHPRELVTREALRRSLWPDGTFVDFEHGLNAVVKRLRDALGDSAAEPRYIETLPRRGYRFIAPVIHAVDPAAAPAVAAPLPDARRGEPVAVGWAAVLLGLTVLGLLVLRQPDD